MTFTTSPQFRTEEQVLGPATMVSLHGELDIQNRPRVADRFDRALERKPATLVADLRGLTFMDSSGVHALLAAEARCRKQGGRFVIIRGTVAVDRVLSLLGLDRLFEIVDGPEQVSSSATPLAISA
jgi:anti-sigma B factor antagonist